MRRVVHFERKNVLCQKRLEQIQRGFQTVRYKYVQAWKYLEFPVRNVFSYRLVLARGPLSKFRRYASCQHLTPYQPEWL